MIATLILAAARRGGVACRSFATASQRFEQQENALYSTGDLPGRNVDLFGPLAVRLVKGKGRGYVATGPIELGDLLLCARPAAALHGPVEDAPDAALLMPQLMALRPEALEWPQRAALAHLSDGTEASVSQPPPPFWDPPSAGGAAASGAAAAASAAWPPPDEALARLIKVNAFGDDYEDLAAAAARGAGGRSCVGLWPAFAYFNHSCLPSTVHYVVGERMVVRAVQDIAEGEEVTISFLGRQEFAPVGARQAVLRERWGFECTCERCAVEAAAPPEVGRAVDAAYARVMTELRPAFLEAAEAGDPSALAAAARGLRDADASVRAALKAHAERAHPATATFAAAALYELHELAYAATQLGTGFGGDDGGERGQEALAALSRCLAIVDAVSRGAELHCFLAARLLELASAARGRDSAAAAAALQLVGQAGEARYGKQLGEKLWGALQAANAELAGEYL
ncbi:hypothetical protein Rsub_06125 [Raphidocelis subcapitata]|uniref:SET domain-containing protein n=1 Tax=Raphidocelis subcapitata TaxID=307507 RepID=A0A2V0P7E3_9CHLO|nr:hypothetical protein Rsub_06125 [Raphidocelis subcapitata]|eukprot:GBF93793.1 hypothetical protein Rsub_06125 [Raphidocelis subcapitata]